MESTPAFRAAMAPAAPPAPARPTPGDAFALARAWVRAGRRLDMVALAAELGVSRGTLYRWTGDRDRLLADVVWADLQALLDVSWTQSRGTGGAARLEAAVGRFLDLVAGQTALRALLAHEGESGLRMLTAHRGPIRPRLLAAIVARLDEEVAAGRYRPPAPLEAIADGVVSIGERFLHNGGDPTLNPDPATAKVVVSLLLRERSG
ncbi:MAG: TetR family transcriptional regulator [Conexibacter sp.]|nr:TetR family transcriptional regulator [Conexibacter sp.]